LKGFIVSRTLVTERERETEKFSGRKKMAKKAANAEGKEECCRNVFRL
jgi:hypothetical protein